MQHKPTVAAMAALLALLLAVAGPAAAQESAPATTLTNDGRTVTDGSRSLSVSQAAGLDPSGQVISVSGQGYPMDKGIYVAFCVIPPTNQPPSPCGGGRGDAASDSDSSMWVSSNPPVYALGVPQPYGPGGTFSGTISVQAVLADGIDCRQVRCAIATRADHTRASDRSLDLFVPLTFHDGSAMAAPPTTAPPPAPTVPTTVAPLDPAQVAPLGTVAADARSVTAGGRELRASAVADLDPEGAEVTVVGHGFDEGRGIFVALCALPDRDPSLPPGASPKPGPCTAGGGGAATWVSSNPPDYGKDLAVPYGPGGSFTTRLVLRAVIDAEHDCRTVGCALVTRNDDTNPADRTQDLLLPVAFAASAAAGPEPAAEAAATRRGVADDRDGGGSGAGPLAAGAAATAAVVAGSAGAIVLRRRGRQV